MKFIFSLDGHYSVEVQPTKYKLIAWQLEELNYVDFIDVVYDGIDSVLSGKDEEWHMSFNSTFLSIRKDKVYFENLCKDSDFVEIELKLFISILKKWEHFVKLSSKRKKFRKRVAFNKF